MKLFQMTTRRWTLAILVVGIVLFAASTMQRWSFFRSRLAYHAQVGEDYRKAVETHRGFIESGERLMRRADDSSGDLRSLIRNPLMLDDRQRRYERTMKESLPAQRRIFDRYVVAHAYHEAMRKKYELAAQRPWMQVEPDPPPPE